jgi:hypothetical protein
MVGMRIRAGSRILISLIDRFGTILLCVFEILVLSGEDES